MIPTGYGRIDDKLYIHGSQASRMLRTLKTGVAACVTVTLVAGWCWRDRLSVIRSTIVRLSSLVTLLWLRIRDKSAALLAFPEHVIQGRWQDVREPTEQELKATTVLVLPLEEVSAKVRTGPPLDDEEDYDLVWAGVVPLRIMAGTPIPDPRLPEEISVPNMC